MITRLLETTNTPLPANGEWASQWYEADWANSIMMSAMADVAGELFYEGSDDGTNVLIAHRVTIQAGGAYIGVFHRTTKFVRIRYKNGGTAQTSFGATLIVYDSLH